MFQKSIETVGVFIKKDRNNVLNINFLPIYEVGVEKRIEIVGVFMKKDRDNVLNINFLPIYEMCFKKVFRL